METLPDQFRDALTRIEIKGAKRKRAQEAHTEIRELLEGNDLLCSWGVDTILIGSYARHTGIHPGKDVDVFCKLTKLDMTANPGEVYGAVCAVLVAHYGERAEPQARSIKVSFDTDGDDFAVDVVPAVRMGERWGIPTKDTERWVEPEPADRWVETDPEELAELATAMNETLKINGQGAYKPTVKLVRQTRKHHLGDEKPGGLYFELLSYWAFPTVPGESFAEVFAGTLRGIATQLSAPEPLMDPVLERPYEPEPDESDRQAAAAKFSDLAAMAEKALTLPRCEAAVLWRQILGENDLGPCFPLPPGCDEKGNEIKKVAPVAAVGPAEASGFA
jgi:hypothetical protein